MIPTQSTRTPIPPIGEVREGASPSARTLAAGPVSPPTEPGRPAQTCSQCRRTAPAKVTINLPGYRWRLCATCLGRGDKTTELVPVDCAHPFARARRTPTGTTYSCLDCFEPMPGPVELDVEHLHSCELCREAGSIRISSVLSVAVLAVILGSLAGATGKLGALIRWLPMPEPALNGYPLAVLLVVGGCCWWRLLGKATTPHEPAELDELATRRQRKLPRGTEPLARAAWHADQGEVGPGPDGAWCTGTATPLIPGDPARRAYLSPQRRRTHPQVPFADLHPDPEEVRPTLLPINTERRVRS